MGELFDTPPTRLGRVVTRTIGMIAGMAGRWGDIHLSQGASLREWVPFHNASRGLPWDLGPHGLLHPSRCHRTLIITFGQTESFQREMAESLAGGYQLASTSKNNSVGVSDPLQERNRALRKAHRFL